jgi:hypothetical protein
MFSPLLYGVKISPVLLIWFPLDLTHISTVKVSKEASVETYAQLFTPSKLNIPPLAELYVGEVHVAATPLASGPPETIPRLAFLPFPERSLHVEPVPE